MAAWIPGGFSCTHSEALGAAPGQGVPVAWPVCSPCGQLHPARLPKGPVHPWFCSGQGAPVQRALLPEGCGLSTARARTLCPRRMLLAVSLRGCPPRLLALSCSFRKLKALKVCPGPWGQSLPWGGFEEALVLLQGGPVHM